MGENSIGDCTSPPRNSDPPVPALCCRAYLGEPAGLSRADATTRTASIISSESTFST